MEYKITINLIRYSVGIAFLCHCRLIPIWIYISIEIYSFPYFPAYFFLFQPGKKEKKTTKGNKVPFRNMKYMKKKRNLTKHTHKITFQICNICKLLERMYKKKNGRNEKGQEKNIVISLLLYIRGKFIHFYV